jgi:oligopeptide/dipeptide ABC transporter ATP-binding protein
MADHRLLSVENLSLHFRTSKGTVRAVDRVSFELRRNDALAILGESGSGKTSLTRALLRLLPRNVEQFSGRIALDGVDVMGLKEEEFRQRVRWVRISLVPQAAMNALNPVLKVGEQVAEPLVTHLGLTKSDAQVRMRQAFQHVGIPVDFSNRYAFELSGGMRQRVAIAMALVTEPDLIILDEPTSALDMLTQANIMNVLKRIKQETETSFILITHDIATSSELANRVAVMYAGQLIEVNDAAHFFEQPLHPYSHQLMASVPRLRQGQEPQFISGAPPSLLDLPSGCRFAPRCTRRFAQCDTDPPPVMVGNEQQVKCWLYPKVTR